MPVRYALVIIIVLASCKKDFLDKRPDKALLVPATLHDFQAILDNIEVMNIAPYLPEISTDDVQTNDDGFAGADPVIQNSYAWKSEIFQGQLADDWIFPYKQVFYSNVVLEGLAKLNRTDSPAEYDRIQGMAYFYRALAFYHLAQEFAKPYNPETASNDPGIPIRLVPDVNIKSTRATVQATYEQIIADLLLAKTLVPAQAGYKSRPCTAAVFGLLAKVYLTMQNYAVAGDYADQCINSNGKLIDYNTLNPAAARPLPLSLPNGNDEVLFYTPLSFSIFLSASSLTRVDSTLYKSYSNDDLRKTCFFRNRGFNNFTFKGGYGGVSDVFGGIATDEIYLIRAECNARADKTEEAMRDLNSLLVKRFRSGTFVPLQASDAADALQMILMERRKELVYRNTRWTDLRRLNQDPKFAVTLTRVLNGQTIILPPNSNKYTFPIPVEEINASGIAQNPR